MIPIAKSKSILFWFYFELYVYVSTLLFLYAHMMCLREIGLVALLYRCASSELWDT